MLTPLAVILGCTEVAPPPMSPPIGADAATFDAGFLADAGEPPDAGYQGPMRWSAALPMPEDRGRWGAQMVFVPSRNQLFMFGGTTYPTGGSSGETWLHHLDLDEWEIVAPAGPQPAPRYCHCLAYLPSTDQVLLVGGRDDRGPRDAEAWLFDLEARAWRRIAGSVPTGVIGCAAAWMPELQRAVVFGGAGRRGFDTRTWAYDPAIEIFEEILTGNNPPGRTDPAAVYDPVGKRVLVFGGAVSVVAPYRHLDDLWAFDGTDWTELSPPSPTPSARRFAASAIVDDRWLMFGGTAEVEDYDDLWAFDFEADTWAQVELQSPPSPRAFAASDYVPGRGLLVVGGLQQAFFSALSDGWRLGR